MTTDIVVEPHKLGTALHALKFITAGNATFTLRSVKTGARFTYNVKRVCCDNCKRDYTGRKQASCKACPCHANKEQGKYFVGVLTGPNNETDYRYMGLLTVGEQGAGLVATRKSQITNEAPSYMAITWFVAKLTHGILPADVEVWHAGSCGMCGRKLTVPESIAIGIGPECLSRWA